MATPPRIVTPGRSVHLIIRASNRQYRFCPTPNVVQSIRYIFWHYAQVHGIEVHEMTWMSNHAHCIVTDRNGVLPRFVGQMNSLISRQLNALRPDSGKGANFEKGYSDIEILDGPTMVGYCAYALANPCKANLVATPKSWKGVTTYAREYGEVFEVKRPNCGLWSKNRSVSHKKESQMPKSTKGCLTRPRVMMHLPDWELRARVRQEAVQKAGDAADLRESSGIRVLGWRRVVKQRWNEHPRQPEEVSTRKKRVAGRRPEDELYHLKRIYLFNQRYREAREDHLVEELSTLLFPFGTWMMKENFNKACEESEEHLLV